MKTLNIFVNEKLVLNKNLKSSYIENKIDIQKLKNFTQREIDSIINWINNDMTKDIRPLVITNIYKSANFNMPSMEIYLFYTYEYEKYEQVPNIRFFRDDKELSVDIYDSNNKIWIRSKIWKDPKSLDECFEFIESKHNKIKQIIDDWNEKYK